MKSLPQILLIDDDPEIYSLVKNALDLLVDLTYVENGERALEEVQKKEFDIMIVDLMLGDWYGIDLIKRIQGSGKQDRARYIILTSKQEVEDEIEGHLLGVCEYIRKPFNAKLMRVQVEKNLREIYKGGKDILKIGDLIIDFSKITVHVVENGEEKNTNLTAKEFQILAYLIKNEGTVIKREQIFETIWNESSESLHRTVDMHISSLRKKMGPCSNYIKTVRSLGYTFEKES